MKRIPWTLLSCFALGAFIWFLPIPAGITPQAWHLLAVFLATILGLITTPLPMGAVAIIALTVLTTTHTFTMHQALSGYGNEVAWLIMFAFFIAKSFVETGLGKRIAYFFTALLGKKTLGLGYGLVATELLVAPAIPSMMARSGGIIYPILQGICDAYQSKPHSPSARRVGAFLTVTSFQATVTTGAMFLTAMAANPLIAALTQEQGHKITWGTWALAGVVPGLLSLILMPLIMYKLCKPEITDTPNATMMAKAKLKEMGPMSSQEWMMSGILVVLLVLWIFGHYWGISAVTAAMLGLSSLLMTRVLSWKSVLKEENAWENLIWFGALLMMATFLNELGIIPWFSEKVTNSFSSVHWTVAFPILALLYFYSHYLFASATAHVSSMYLPMLAIAISLGTPPMLAIFILMFSSNLFGGFTHYSCGPAALLYGAGYVGIKEWWKLGFISSLVNIAIWGGVGSLWWKFLGFW